MDVTDLPEDPAERRKLLVKHYGAPKRIHAGEPLRVLGLRDQIHPSDVVAFVYPSVASFDIYSQTNQRFNGFPTYGPLIMSPKEVVGVIDYRRVLPLLTDPTCDDNTPSASAGPASSLATAEGTPHPAIRAIPSAGVRRPPFDTYLATGYT